MGLKKNPKGGKGHRKKKKPQVDDHVKTIIYREEGSEYAKVISLLGSGRLRVQLPNKTEKLAIIPGRMKKKKVGNFISVDDIILVGIRDWQTNADKVDVLHRYNSEQVLILNGRKELPIHWTSDIQDNSLQEMNVDESIDLNLHRSNGDDIPTDVAPLPDTLGIDFDEI